MPDNTRAFDIIIGARDEASATFRQVSENARRLDEFRAKMERQNKGGDSGVGGLAKGALLAAVSIEGVSKASEVANEELQKMFDGGQSGAEAFAQTWSKTFSDNAFLKPIVEAGKSVAGMFGTLAVAAMEYSGTSHEVSQSTLLNAFNFAKETKAITELRDEASQATKSLHGMIGDIGVKGLEKDLRDADKEVDAFVTAATDRAKGILASNDSSADQKAAAMETLANISDLGEELRAKKKAEIQKANNKAEIDRERQQSLDMGDIAAAGRAAALAEAQRDSDAAVEQINAKYDRLHSEEAARAERAAKESPEHAQAITEDSAQKQAANEDARNAEILRSRRDAARQQTQIERDRSREIEDLNTLAEATRLRSVHRETEAELLELRSAHGKEMADLDNQLKDKSDRLAQVDDEDSRKRLAKEIADTQARKEARERVFNQQAGALQQRAGEEGANRQAAIEHDLADLRIKGLKEEGELGNKAADAEAQRLEKVEKYKSVREDILRMLREEKDLSDDQRKQLEGELKANEARQKEAESQLTSGGVSAPKQLAGTQEGNTLTGVQQASREQQFSVQSQQLQEQKKQTTALQELAKSIDQLPEVVRQMVSASLAGVIPLS